MGWALAVAAALALSACSGESWLGENKAPPLPGKRISVLSQDKDLQPDTKGGKPDPILLPPPDPNDDWPQAGGYANHAMHHMVVGDAPQQVWSTNVGTGSGKRVRLLAQPILAEGRIFTVDADNDVYALDADTGDIVWETDITPPDIEGSSSGGLAYEDGRLFVGTGFAQVVAIEAKTGQVLWTQPLSGPMRGAPTVRGGRVFVVTVDNQLHCLAADDGQVQWTHQGISEQAAMLAGNSPAIDGNVVVVPYSSGELFALRVENGSVLWQDSLGTMSRTQSIAALTDIGGRPIIDRGRVYAIGHADMLTAIDLRTGRRLWEREIGGIQPPWVAGDYLFLITNNNETLALEAKTGRVVWVTQLKTWQDPVEKSGRIVWTGPVLASDRLIYANSRGQLLTLSPYTGMPLGQDRINEGVTIQPIVANETIYFFTDDADVVAYR